MLPHTSTIMMRRNSAMERASKTNNTMTASSSSGSIGHQQYTTTPNSHLHQSPVLTSIENQLAPKHVQISPVIPPVNRRQR